jgi:hypothetical protein
MTDRIVQENLKSSFLEAREFNLNVELHLMEDLLRFG